MRPRLYSSSSSQLRRVDHIWACVDASLLRTDHIQPVALDELITGSDYLTIQAPLTADTYHLFDDATLARMKPTAILINTARGPIVEDAALDRALRQGTIAAAAIDDLEEEPAKQGAWQPTNPLLQLPNVIVTPHAAYYSEQSISLVRRIAAEEAVRVLRGLAPLSPVNTVEARSQAATSPW